MIDDRSGLEARRPPSLVQPPAEVQVLGVHPLALVEATHLVPGTPPNE
jgi:hypothetical protein